MSAFAAGDRVRIVTAYQWGNFNGKLGTYVEARGSRHLVNVDEIGVVLFFDVEVVAEDGHVLAAERAPWPTFDAGEDIKTGELLEVDQVTGRLARRGGQ